MACAAEFVADAVWAASAADQVIAAAVFNASIEMSGAAADVVRTGSGYTIDPYFVALALGRTFQAETAGRVLEADAEGRVFAGTRAKERALVDSIGGLVAAIEYARGMAGIERRCRVVHLPARKSSIVEMIGSTAAGDAIAALEPIRNALQDLYRSDEAWLFLYPYRIEIK